MGRAEETDTQSHKRPQGPLSPAPRKDEAVAHIPRLGLSREARPQNHSPSSQLRAECPGLGNHPSGFETSRKDPYPLGDPSAPFSSVGGASACGFLQTPRGLTPSRSSRLVEQMIRSWRSSDTWVAGSWRGHPPGTGFSPR